MNIDLDGKNRCFGNKPGQDEYKNYHDNEWGIPVHDDKKLFEMLILEGAQAGLTWETILKRREGYRKAFYGFDAHKVAKMTDADLEGLLMDPGIIRNRLKVYGTRKNAKIFLEIIKEFGSFDDYLWRFVGGNPMVNSWRTFKEVPVLTGESKALSKDLRKRGMTFVGPTIMYAFMQAIGMVDDHLMECWCHGRRKV
jgi:DNA-3-methyladenine glycosylase I